MSTVLALDTAVPVGTYHIDASHSQFGFRVRHMGLAWTQGTFSDFTAIVESTDGTLAGLKAEATVQVGSINTGNTDRDNHLRSPDFFDAASHPVLTFVSDGVQHLDGASFHFTGHLTIRGTTQPVVLNAEYLGTEKDPWGNTRIAFTAETKISRKDFGLTWNQFLESGGLVVGDEVRIAIELEFIQQA